MCTDLVKLLRSNIHLYTCNTLWLLYLATRSYKYMFWHVYSRFNREPMLLWSAKFIIRIQVCDLRSLFTWLVSTGLLITYCKSLTKLVTDWIELVEISIYWYYYEALLRIIACIEDLEKSQKTRESIKRLFVASLKLQYRNIYTLRYCGA